jgi:hypothetical protein
MKRGFNAADKLLTARKAVNAEQRPIVIYQRLDGDANQRMLRQLRLIFW